MTTPEEELYVLVHVTWQSGLPRENLGIISNCAHPLSDVMEHQKRLGNTYGKTRIARLQFVEEE